MSAFYHPDLAISTGGPKLARLRALGGHNRLHFDTIMHLSENYGVNLFKFHNKPAPPVAKAIGRIDFEKAENDPKVKLEISSLKWIKRQCEENPLATFLLEDHD